MKDILAAANRDVLAQFAHSNVLLAFDFDGTLAPIVDQPDEARMRPETRALLERVAQLYPCIVISGRSQADALKRLRNVGLREVIGNHGIEPWRQMGDYAGEVRSWIPKLQSSLEFLKGVHIEDKNFSLAIHYRHSREKKLAKLSILEAVSQLRGVRIIGGKEVINVLPKGAPHKGTALQAARQRLGCDTALYVGDDETDEDVFSLDEPGRLLGIRVGQAKETAVSYFIDSQQAVDTLLESLVALRSSAAESAYR